MEGKKMKARASFGGSAPSPQPSNKMPRQAPRTAPAKGRLVHEDVDRDISFKKPAASVGSAGGPSLKKDKRKSTAVSAHEADFEKTFGLVGHGFGGDLSLDDDKEAFEDDDAFGASGGSGSDSENEELAAAQLEAHTSVAAASELAASKRNGAVASFTAAAPTPAASSKKTAQASVAAPTTSAAKPARLSSASALSTAAPSTASKGKKVQTASKTATAPAPSESEEEGSGSDSAPSGAAASASRTGGAASAGKHGALVAGKVAFAIDSAASSRKGKSGAAPPPQQPKTALFDSDEEEEDDAEEDDVEAASGDEGEGETDEDEDEEEEGDSSDEEGDGADDEYSGGDIIAAQRRMDKRAARIAEESAAEMRLNIASGEAAADLFMLPSAGELAEERAGPPNLAVVKKRVEEVIAVLADFRKFRDPSRSRKDYVDCLAQDLADYYGYNRELVDMFLQLFPPSEARAFLEENEKPRPTVVRTNTLKTNRRNLAQALTNRGVNLDGVGAWSRVGLKIFESSVPVGATPEYLAGHYMLQMAASFVPCMALDPQPGERVLDMAAAPGGKTTYLAQLMGNSGVLVANELKRERLASLSANLHRMGVHNAIISCMDGRKIPDCMRGFDRVLLDAPCTGLGIISRDPSVRTQKTREDITKMAFLQKQLALAAIDAIDAESATGGILVYSTCSVTVEENEAVVNYLLRKRHVKLLPIFKEGSDDPGRPGLTAWSGGKFHPSLSLTRRFYPHVQNMDGFFAAKIKKISNKIPADDGGDDDIEEHKPSAAKEAASSTASPAGTKSTNGSHAKGSRVSRAEGKAKPTHAGAGRAPSADASAPVSGFKRGRPAPAAESAGKHVESAAGGARAASEVHAPRGAHGGVGGRREGSKGPGPAAKRPRGAATDADTQPAAGAGRPSRGAPTPSGDGDGGVVSFLKPGEKINKFGKKRKAGRRVREQQSHGGQRKGSKPPGPGGRRGGPAAS